MADCREILHDSLILNKVSGVTQGQYMTNFEDIKTKMADW